MKEKIKSYFESLKPKQLGLMGNKVKVNSISKLGQGTGHLNYLVYVNNKKFVFRLNMEINNTKKSRKEFNSLKIIEKYKIGPKPILINESKKFFDTDLIILEYIEGKLLNKTKEYLKPKMYKELGKLCAKIHSIKIIGKLKELDYNETFYGYENEIRFIKKQYINYLDSNLNNKELLKIINKTFSELSKNISKKKYRNPGK